jgi:hypothetical protein
LCLFDKLLKTIYLHTSLERDLSSVHILWLVGKSTLSGY